MTFKSNYLFIGLALFIIISLFMSCDGEYFPKPRGFYRIDFPNHEYQRYDSVCPYTFDYPIYSVVVDDTSAGAEPCWFNIEFKKMNAKVYMSYKTGKDNINGYIEDSYNMVYKHTIKADAINERVFADSNKKVYGVLYEIKGNAASSLQFFVTDSIQHFLRGALYFNSVPNKDSLKPVIEFIKPDIIRLIESVEWKTNHR